MTTNTRTSADDLTAIRSGNEATWRKSAVALYAGDIEEFLRHWVAVPRYTLAYPVAGLPATVEGREQLMGLFGAFGAFAEQITVHDVQFHQTTDPAVAFVEERMVAVLNDGTTYENLLAIRVTFEDGLISELYEYCGEVAHADLVRRLTSLQP